MGRVAAEQPHQHHTVSNYISRGVHNLAVNCVTHSTRPACSVAQKGSSGASVHKASSCCCAQVVSKGVCLFSAELAAAVSCIICCRAERQERAREKFRQQRAETERRLAERQQQQQEQAQEQHQQDR